MIDLQFKSRTNVLKMLANRGYDISQHQNYTKEEIGLLLSNHIQGNYKTSNTRGPLDLILTRKSKDNSNKSDKVFVKYRLDQKMTKKDTIIKHAAAIFDENKLDKTCDCLIILNIGAVFMKPGAKDDSVQTVVNRCLLGGMFVQIFGLENFLIDIASNHYVPKHTLLNDKETVKILDRYNITITNMPKIKREDPMAKYIGARPGQVVKIETFNPTNGTEPAYRVVIMQE